MRYLCVFAVFLTSFNQTEATAQTLWNLEKLSQAPQVTWLDSDSGIRSLIFTGPEFNGNPTEVFAFYATPGSVSGDSSKDRNLPAVVCVHGGGGTAFAEWVNLWAKRGYAAIALDFSGRRPDAPKFDEQGQLIVERDHRKITRQRLPHGGPEHGHVEKFENVGGNITDDWQYHAISNIMLAHSLVRSFPEVDPERTAITGISWGGYLTCIAAGVDQRFKAAVPVYGCGFLYEGESVQKNQIDRLPKEKRENWIRMYDPSKHLVNCRVPILFVNGTNDVHYPLDSYMKSYHAVPGEKNLRVKVAMRHGHPPGWAPQEIENFIASKIANGKPLAKIGRPGVLDAVPEDIVVADLTTTTRITKAQTHWTLDSGLLSKRNWKSSPAEVVNQNLITAASPPAGTTIWFLSVTDERGAMTSSEMVFESKK